MRNKPNPRIGLRSPVDPVELFRRLARALDIPLDVGEQTPESIVDRSMPGLNAGNFRDAYLLKEVLRKYPAFDLGIDTEAAAFDAFFADEQLNRETNDRLRGYNAEDPRVEQVLFFASRKIAHVLGRFDPATFLEGLRFGPGATQTKSRRKAAVEWKLSDTSAVSRVARPVWEACYKQLPVMEGLMEAFGAGCPECDSERLDCVPKNAKTGRTIGIGPDFNVMMQLALDYCLRRKLFRAGINLSDQTINQNRAYQGSITGDLATVDLKSASNSISQGLVWKLIGMQPIQALDPIWYRLLEALRLEKCLVKGKYEHEYELFSAMGNGYTFALESLIFWSLSSAACSVLGVREDVTVYGDDIILPSAAVPFLTETFGWCGLRLNLQKSFWGGKEDGAIFRESCGVHYLNGRDVTPFYVDSPLKRVDEVLLLANNIVRWSRFPGFGRDRRLLPVWLWVISHLPRSVRKCRIPFGEENDGLISDFDEACPSTYKDPECSMIWDYKVNVVRRIHLETFCWIQSLQYGAWLYNAGQKRFTPPKVGYWWDSLPTEQDDEAPLDQGNFVFQFRKRHVVDWPLIGPWVDEDNTQCLTVLEASILSELTENLPTTDQ